MQSKWFKNYDQIATSKQRQDLLAIAAAGLDAIDTESVIKNYLKITDYELRIKNQTFDLKKFKNIKVIGFGKVSCAAAVALEQALKDKISEGIALGIEPISCEVIQTYGGTHPQPSEHNVEISGQIMELAKNATENDLVIVVVSGGGSALLCYPQNECDQGQILYHQFLKGGGTIEELNTVRKHISQLKGGGLAKLLYPATVIGLIFSDIPGDDYSEVASGPTFFDPTTVADAERIIKKYGLSRFQLNETPKEQKYFEQVTNIPLVANSDALEAMAAQSKALGYSPAILSNEMYDEAPMLLTKMRAALAKNSLVLAGGEPRMFVRDGSASGGRNLYVSLRAATQIRADECFLALASDGLDNSDAAGAIVDKQTLDKIKTAKLDVKGHLRHFDGYNFFKQLDELIFTGPTQANVSDLFILLK
ncbi:MAG: hypothetical protein A3E98_04585 [Candidatus Doudnabacteria bacterium RIFCSPHIGHO2_12_FULL_48_11]|uniref:Glycerate kinase n=1 Tax=Candidatus Doudnabacteria bacterium RIFCSPHIGHO2_01_FULL_46_24 TaxID=1817825 RepID=A0A1F5NSU7_9BACT|nr:MAG: hypothetical protein A2720_04105 [Candidatus Doudnabacteria bacterium RIFCSPHIGHO2_01_FULL_46_24]OGE95354.1 MAG: hypothetical protein A3E98_04585 [Candidatus Doudnabacteria bacterium RIFCSPHIGHO2_12_FULL_48_11]